MVTGGAENRDFISNSKTKTKQKYYLVILLKKTKKISF